MREFVRRRAVPVMAAISLVALGACQSDVDGTTTDSATTETPVMGVELVTRSRQISLEPGHTVLDNGDCRQNEQPFVGRTFGDQFEN